MATTQIWNISFQPPSISSAHSQSIPFPNPSTRQLLICFLSLEIWLLWKICFEWCFHRIWPWWLPKPPQRIACLGRWQWRKKSNTVQVPTRRRLPRSKAAPSPTLAVVREAVSWSGVCKASDGPWAATVRDSWEVCQGPTPRELCILPLLDSPLRCRLRGREETPGEVAWPEKVLTHPPQLLSTGWNSISEGRGSH